MSTSLPPILCNRLTRKKTSLAEPPIDRASIQKTTARSFKISWATQLKDLFCGLRKTREYALERAHAIHNRYFNNMPQDKQAEYLKALQNKRWGTGHSLKGLRKRNWIEFDEQQFNVQINAFLEPPRVHPPIPNIELDDKTLAALWKRYHGDIPTVYLQFF